MKTKHFYLVPVLLVTLLFTQSCKDDDEDDIIVAPKEMIVGDKTISLENANIELVGDGANSTWRYRNYSISDGTYKNNGSKPYEFINYENATYLIYFNLAVKVSETSEILTTGEYPQYSDWGLAEDTGKTIISYMLLETADVVGYYDTLRETDGGDHPPIIVSGSLNGGEQMTITSEGTMNYDDGPTDVPVTFSLSYKGIVVDKIN